jgi:hypothetical protein
MRRGLPANFDDAGLFGEHAADRIGVDIPGSSELNNSVMTLTRIEHNGYQRVPFHSLLLPLFSFPILICHMRSHDLRG